MLGAANRCEVHLDAKGVAVGPDEIAQCVKFPCEGQISGIAQQGHFKDVEVLRARSVINPFGIGIIIPHLPEKSADQSAER